MTAKRRDIKFANDDQACRTVVLDFTEETALRPAASDEEEATVVLELTPEQVHEVLTNPNATFRNTTKK